MTELERLREQVRTQEMDILRLRAENGEKSARIANLIRINATLQSALSATKRQVIRQAETLFEGRT
mgnify:FL=1